MLTYNILFVHYIYYVYSRSNLLIALLKYYYTLQNVLFMLEKCYHISSLSRYTYILEFDIQINTKTRFLFNDFNRNILKS